MAQVPGAAGEMHDPGVPKRGRLARLSVNALLLAASIALSVAVSELVLRAAGAGNPCSLYLYAAGSELPDRQTGWDLVYRINASGLRGLPVPIERPPGVSRRIVVLGDSFTFGEGVEDADAFPVQLQDLFQADAPGTEVVNLGIIGTDTEAYRVLLEDVGLRYNPDVVVVNAYGNDASSTRWPSGSGFGVKDLISGSRLVTLARRVRRVIVAHRASALAGDPPAFWGEIEARCREQAPAEECARRLAEFLDHYGSQLNSTAAACLSDPADVRRWVETDTAGPGWSRFSRDLEEMAALTRARGIPLVVSIVPDGPQVSRQQLAFREGLGVSYPPDVLTASGGFQNAVIGLASNLKIPCVDPTNEFRASPAELYFESDLHWNREGHLLYAEILHRFLLAEGLLDHPPRFVGGVSQTTSAALPPVGVRAGHRGTQTSGRVGRGTPRSDVPAGIIERARCPSSLPARASRSCPASRAD